MSSAHSMNARKCVHAEKPYQFKAVAQGSSKVGEREKRNIGEIEVRRLMERKAAQQKHIGGTKTRPTKAQLRCTKGRSAELPLATALPPTYIKAKESFHSQC